MRSDWRPAVLVAFGTLAVGFLTMTPHLIGVFFDDGLYLLVAKAIATGQGYVYPQLPGTPPAIHYPPVWPALLAVVWRIAPEFPGSVVWFKAINPVLLALAAAGAVRVAERLFGFRPWVGALAVLAATASVPMHVLSNVLLSEPLFLALLCPTLLVTARLHAEGGLRWLLAAAGLAALLTLTRTIGGVVVIATVMILASERRWGDALRYVCVVTVLLLPWQLFVWRQSGGFPPELEGSYGPYLSWIADGYREGGWPFFRDVVGKNLSDGARSVGVVITPWFPGVIRSIATWLALLLAAMGIAAAARRRSTRLLTLALIGYLAVVVLWPFQVDRFLWAVWPLLLLFALDGTRAVVRALQAAARPRAAGAVLAVAAVLVLGHGAYNVRGFSRGWASSAARQLSDGTAPLIQYVNTDPRLQGKTIATPAAPMVALYTGLQVVPMEMLVPSDHLGPKTPEASAEIVGRLDRRFRPDAYVLPPAGPHVQALLSTRFEPDRRFVEITPPGFAVRSFHVLMP